MKFSLTSRRTGLFCCLSIFFLSGCLAEKSERKNDTDIPAVNQNALKAHVTFLADDLLKGRATGTDGYNIAAKYVASHFSQFGLKTAGDPGSYLQKITFQQRQIDTSGVRLILNKPDGKVALSPPDDFVTRGSSLASELKITAPLVFAGFGIDAPVLQHQDYADLNVEGKIVVVLAGQPESFPSEEGAHFASARQRALAAADRGAVGIMILHTPQAEKRFSYNKMKYSMNHPWLSWLDADGNPGNSIAQIKGSALLSQQASAELLADAPVNYETLISMVENQEPLPKFELGFSASIETRSNFKNIESYNVVGMVEGTDPVLKQEYIIYTAHLDHLGEYDQDDGDSIHNGALDNASGTAIMLETARLFAQHPPKRSVLFLAVTAEEKGLLGSDYYAQNPTVPIEQIVANINLDMPLILYPIGDVIAFGAQHSTMEGYVKRAAERLDLQLSPDPMPEQNVFVRSDHYSFVKQGVPAVFLVPGFKSLDESINGGEIFQKFFKQHYHQPSDEASLPIDYQAGARFTQVNFLIGREIGNSPTRPQWHEGNFFGDTFSQ